MAEVLYTARFQLPTLIERGRANLIQCPVYRAGALVQPSSGTVAIYDQTNTAVVSAAAVTITSSIAGYSYNPASTLTCCEGWRVEWALVMLDGVTHTFRNEAALVRNLPSPSVTEADLYRRVSSLDPSGTAPISKSADYADKIDEAWVHICNRLIEAGNRPNLIVSPSALRDAHLLLVLAMIFEDFATRLNAAYIEQARLYRDQFAAAWGRVRLTYDLGDDGAADIGKKATQSTVWLTSRGLPSPRERWRV